jgi:hypothetical protein
VDLDNIGDELPTEAASSLETHDNLVTEDQHASENKEELVSEPTPSEAEESTPESPLSESTKQETESPKTDEVPRDGKDL